ncbi:Hypothetical predicted protein, partial [Scomber scombrus]
NQLVKLHYEDCEATSNGVRVATRRPSIPRNENTFGFLMALLNSYHHENWYTGPGCRRQRLHSLIGDLTRVAP